nr:hypothetical protein [Tanacetum cinerariifolium]
YTELLKPIPEPHQVPQNDNNVISEDTNVEQSREIVEQHPVNVEETRSLYDSLYHNLAIEVEKVNTVNRKLKETNAKLTTELARFKNQERPIEVEKVNTVNRKLKETNAKLTTELARFKNQERRFEISQEKYDKLERCYQQSVYQEQCLSKKINALYLSFGKQIMTLTEEILDLNKQLSKEKSTVSFLLEEKKKLKSDFKIREDELLDKKIQLEKRIKELDNILVKTEETLQLAQESHQKMKQLNKDIKLANYTKINHLSGVKSTIVTLQRVVKHRMTLETHNWSSSTHLELHKIVKDENFPIVNQVDTRVQNFEIKFLKEVAKFVRDFKSLAKKADESLAKHKALELEIERLLRAFVSQDIMSVMQKASVVDTSNLQTKLERIQERFENCIIKKENEYAKLWNDWYKKCEECRFDKILYDKAYNDMQQNIDRLQAQLGDLKGKRSSQFVGDFKSLANEADASLAKHKALELEIKRLLKAVVSQDIMIIMQNESVVDTSDLQTELERTKERFEKCIIKKETEFAKLWNDWYKKCDECKYDKISYDKAYNDMQQKIERLQAQLGDLKGKSKDTSSVSDTQNPLSQKLKN